MRAKERKQADGKREDKGIRDFYNQEAKSVLYSFRTDPDSGLSTEEVKKRAEKYGKNKLQSKNKISPLVIFFRQFKSFIIYILLFALAISVISGEYIDSGVIFAILIFNSFFGFIQEFKAEKAVEALKKLSSLKAKIIRNGRRIQIDADGIVPGDILILEEGDKISADARIFEDFSLQVSESALTGESAPVSKSSSVLKRNLSPADMKNMVFSGTSVTRGRARAVVVSIGMQTEIGKIAGMITETEKEITPLQEKLEALGKWIGIGVIAIAAIVFITGITKEGSISFFLAGNFLKFIFEARQWFLTAVALAVAAVPEGLPAVVTIALALGVRKMARKHSLIRRLPSVETLGETTVICSDKTGTLTKNEMTVKKAYTNLQEFEVSGQGYELEGDVRHKNKPMRKDDMLLFRIGALCNNASLYAKEEKGKVKTETTGDPTEIALLVSAEKAGIKISELRASWKKIHEEPFDSERKMMSTVHTEEKTKKSFVFTKGAPETVLEKCDKILVNGRASVLTSKMKKQILLKNDEFAKNALRVLGFAYKPVNNGEKRAKSVEEKLVFVGLQGMIDPPRKEVSGSIEKCRDAGIRVVMITGDNVHTAEAIAREIGIKGESMNGMDFSKLSEKGKIKIIEKISVFARVEPRHKMEIVKILQGRGEVVAMTGDGVNDSPALKKADIGIAMGIKGTDVAKEASDMILEDDNFATIVNSVEEGRGIYENIRKFVNYLLSSNLAEVLVIFTAILLSWPLPMTAIMLLWINLVTDGLPALSLSADPNPENLMKKPPKKAKDKIMNKSMAFNVIYVGVLITIAILGLFYWGMISYSGLEETLFIAKIQTLAFTAIIVMELVRLQAIRSEYKLGILSNKWLILAVAVSLILQLLVVYTPASILFGTVFLSLKDWAAILAATATVFVLTLAGVRFKNKIKWFDE